ncbi:hypothetical protein E2562_031231 [Oryza meyeriana var. granulata]|uniref:Uncharacterized protein n=1 Tax=Oryza meyeriana var. granulata TaxID=110450 RepID=A0A6G1DQR4_9ORYZ|nr:hypothetical protein E2562_031231 [Oryza meyeriana var. granulata]
MPEVAERRRGRRHRVWLAASARLGKGACDGQAAVETAELRRQGEDNGDIGGGILLTGPGAVGVAE